MYLLRWPDHGQDFAMECVVEVLLYFASNDYLEAASACVSEVIHYLALGNNVWRLQTTVSSDNIMLQCTLCHRTPQQ